MYKEEKVKENIEVGKDKKGVVFTYHAKERLEEREVEAREIIEFVSENFENLTLNIDRFSKGHDLEKFTMEDMQYFLPGGAGAEILKNNSLEVEFFVATDNFTVVMKRNIQTQNWVIITLMEGYKVPSRNEKSNTVMLDFKRGCGELMLPYSS